MANIKVNGKLIEFAESKNTENLTESKNAEKNVEKYNNKLQDFANGKIDFAEEQTEKSLCTEEESRLIAKSLQVVNYYSTPQLIKVRVAKELTESGKRALFFYVLPSRLSQQLGIKGERHTKESKGERELRQSKEKEEFAEHKINSLGVAELESLLAAAKKREKEQRAAEVEEAKRKIAELQKFIESEEKSNKKK